MKKRLLLSLLALCLAISGFALSKGDFVFTPQGRFQITGDNLNANNAFQSMDGWTAIGEGKTLADLFITNADGLSAGFNSVVSTAATAGEGMYFKFEPTSADGTYIVSFKMKGAALDNIRVRIPGDGYKTEANLVKVAGNDANVYTHPATEGEVIANTAEELNENWQTFNYAIVGDGTARTWFISFTAMATTIEIADLQIAPAMQFADLRQRDAMLNKLNAYKNCYNWSEDLLDEYAVNEYIANLEAIGDESGQAELDELLTTAQEVLDEFVNANMDDYLPSVEVTATTNNAGSPKVDVKFSQWFAKVQKAYTWGDWQCLPSGRGFWENESQGAADFGHYAGNSAWNYGDVEGAMGIYMNKTLDAGSYVFGIESAAALREDATSSSWTNNEAWDVAFGVAYIVKVENEVTTDTVASLVMGLDAVNYTTFTVPVTITESGTYEIGFKAYCKDGYKDLKNGSVLYIKNASIWGKNNNKYNQKQLGYEADVLEQIKAGRDNITTAIDNIDNPDYFWGKDELQACLDSVENKIAGYEAMSQDDIIATYEDYYVKSTSDPETGLMVYEVYQAAVKDIIAANKKFKAVNDTLASIQTAISNAEAVLAMRLYSAAAGKDALQAAIDKAKGIQAQMKAAQYSEENAAAIVAANAELADAVEVFKNSIPAESIATLVDIDFENDAVQNEETQLYSVAGAAGSMEFSNWSTDGTGTQPFEKGFWSNGEQLWKGYIRIGNGTGTVVFDPTVNGSMGTNILKVACDLYVQGLSGRSLGFFLKNVVEGESGPEDANVFGLFHNFYNGTTETNTCNVDISKIWAKSGGSYNNASPADATDSVTANPLQKSHIEVIMDFGTNKMYCTISSVNGETVSEEVALEAIPTKFILQCNYNNNDRRAWFDNLKIQRIATSGEIAPEEDPELVAPTGWISEISNGNLAGDNVANYIAKEYPSTTPVGAAIVAGAGKNGSRGIVVKSQDKVDQAWDSQFWIYLDETLPAGSKLHVEFDYKADKAGTVGTQSHAAPGAYLHWAAIGNVSFTEEWQHFSADVDVPGEAADMQSIALNLNDIAEGNTYYFDNFGVWAQKPAPVDEWADLIVNGNMEGESMECFYVTEQGVGGPFVAVATDGIGKDGGKAVKVQSQDNPAQDWDTQFFIRLPYQLPAGTKFKVSFDYKADKAGDFDTQAHTEPGGYIHWACIGSGSFTTDWQTYEKEGSISADMSKDGQLMQTIAFNLAKNKAATEFIFDNVKFEVEASVAATLTKNPAENPTPYPVGIYTLSADQKNGTIFDLQGRRVVAPRKGLYIIDGKKAVVK